MAKDVVKGSTPRSCKREIDDIAWCYETICCDNLFLKRALGEDSFEAIESERVV